MTGPVLLAAQKTLRGAFADAMLEARKQEGRS